MTRFQADGPAGSVVLSHATGFCTACWRPMVSQIEHSVAQILGWDHRGHGRSTGGSVPVSWWEMASDARRVISELVPKPAPVIGVGHSMGGAVLAMVELVSPGTFDGLVLVEPILLEGSARRRPYPLAGVVRKRRRVFESRESARANFGRKAPFSCWDPIALDGYIEEGLVERHGQIELSCSPEFEAEVYDAASAHGLLELVSEVDVPAVVIVGDRSDTYSVEWGAAIARAFGRGELVVVGGGTHFIPMERPDVVAAEALSVLRSLASAQ